MRTTIRLDDSLLAEAKTFAVKTGRTLTAVIEDALRASLAPQAQTPGTEGWTRLPTVGGQGLRPGVDLDSTSDLIDIMERDDPR